VKNADGQLKPSASFTPHEFIDDGRTKTDDMNRLVNFNVKIKGL